MKKAPYGYRVENGRLVHDDAEQAVIARVRQARAEGLTVREIAEGLRIAGVCSRGGRPIATSAEGLTVRDHLDDDLFFDDDM